MSTDSPEGGKKKSRGVRWWEWLAMLAIIIAVDLASISQVAKNANGVFQTSTKKQTAPATEKDPVPKKSER